VEEAAPRGTVDVNDGQLFVRLVDVEDTALRSAMRSSCRRSTLITTTLLSARSPRKLVNTSDIARTASPLLLWLLAFNLLKCRRR
jgi:hypothetical protein